MDAMHVCVDLGISGKRKMREEREQRSAESGENLWNVRKNA